MTKSEAISIIKKSPLGAYGNQLVAALLPSARIHATRDLPARQTGSHLGGVPSLPGDVPWPHWDCVAYLDAEIARQQAILGRVPPHENFAKLVRGGIEKLEKLKAASPLPLAFLGQIDLTDLAGLEVARLLPPGGMLWFFCDMFQQPWGFDPLSRGAWRCLHSTSAPRIPTPAPKLIRAEWTRPEAAVLIEEQWTLPPVLPLGRGKTVTRQNHADYDVLCERLSSSKEPIYRFCGWPQEAGEDMRLEIQLAANGVFCGDPSAMRHPRRRELEPGAKDWALLLQLDSGGEMDWGWGDMGRLYLWCRAEEMARGKFDATWLAIASH